MAFIFNPMYPDATDAQKWDQIKLWRNAELSMSDWTQLPDAPVDKLAWAKYRQELRDLPQQGGIANEAQFPVKP
jgi:hypothetical protein